jgi:hypothetical protein
MRSLLEEIHMEQEQQQTFDPARYLISINGNLYLEVKWRLVWLRNIFPDATLETELVSHADGQAVFKAKATLPSGASATGYGSESANRFPEYIESAETKAIGRCLAALGFGSQFCTDFDLADKGILADSPVRPIGESRDQAGTVYIEQPMTAKQNGLIQFLAKDLGMTAKNLDDLAQDVAGCAAADLNRRAASMVIEELKSRGAGNQTADVS